MPEEMEPLEDLLPTLLITNLLEVWLALMTHAT